MRRRRPSRKATIARPWTSAAEADSVLSAARDAGRLAVVYQNRRFDPDHLAVRRLVQSGGLGEVFHVEAFVGGYGHPCNLWHSDEGVSGGAFYDWGSHVLDQVLAACGLIRPDVPPREGVRGGTGRHGWHTEALSRLLAEMQVVARAHREGTW